MPQNGDLQVWWIPQVPMKAFTVLVTSISEAKKILEVLANYDLFQFNNNVKPDYSNAGGLCIWEDEEWIDWTSEAGCNIDELNIEEIEYQISIDNSKLFTKQEWEQKTYESLYQRYANKTEPFDKWLENLQNKIRNHNL